MARPKTQLNRREEIIVAAQILFAEKGFEKTRIDDIARRIGIGKGTVYLDFRNKDEILQAIIERNVTCMFDQLEEQVSNAAPPYLELIRQLIRNDVLTVFDMVTSQVHTHVALMHTSYKLKQDLDYLLLRGRNILASLLRKAENNGEIRQFPDYENLAHLINISIQGFFPPYDFKFSLDYRKDLTKEEIRTLLYNDASVVIDIILAGIKA